MENTDRQRGCLIGLAVGDALGAAVEFKLPGSFELVTGYRAGGPHGLDPGEWTDDTSMALALADSDENIIEGNDAPGGLRLTMRSGCEYDLTLKFSRVDHDDA